MSTADGVGARIERAVARVTDVEPPESEGLPRYVSPLPEWVENVGLRLAWPVAAANLLGTVFGFWYYAGRPLEANPPLIEGQLGAAPLAAWPLVPDSPVATLFIGLSIVAWRLGWDADVLHALAFFGCIKLGLWTPYVQLVLNGPGHIATWLYWFLILSHLAMAVEAAVVHRYADFRVESVAVALVWYGGNDLVDYFTPVFGDLHHTWFQAEIREGVVSHSSHVHDLAAAWAVVLTVAATFFALATRVEKMKRGAT